MLKNTAWMADETDEERKNHCWFRPEKVRQAETRTWTGEWSDEL